MKLKMQARHLWDAVEYDDVEFDDDHSALDAIYSAVPTEMVPALATKATAKEAWEAIKTLRIMTTGCGRRRHRTYGRSTNPSRSTTASASKISPYA